MRIQRWGWSRHTDFNGRCGPKQIRTYKSTSLRKLSASNGTYPSSLESSPLCVQCSINCTENVYLHASSKAICRTCRRRIGGSWTTCDGHSLNTIHTRHFKLNSLRQRFITRTTARTGEYDKHREDEIPKSHADECQSEAQVENKTRERRFAISVLVGSMFFCNMHRVLTAVLAIPLADRFGFNMVELGFLQSSFLWGYGLNQVPSGIAADAYGGVRLMLLGLCFWSLSTATVPLVGLIDGGSSSFSSAAAGAVSSAAKSVPAIGAKPQLIYLMASRCLMGMASAVALPSVSSCVSRLVNVNHRAGTLSLIYGAFNAGTVVGLFGVPLIFLRVGWEATFAIVGGIGFVCSILAYSALRIYCGDVDSISNNDILATENEDEMDESGVKKSLAEKNEKAKISESKTTTTSTTIFHEISRLPKAKLTQVFGLMWSHSVIGWGFFVLLNWIPTYITKSLGQTSLSSTGTLSALPWCCTVFTSFLAGKFSDRLINKEGVPVVRARSICMLISTIGPGLALLLIAFFSSSLLENIPIFSGTPSTPFIITSLSFALGCLAFSYSGFHSYIQDVSGGRAGALLATTNSAGIIMGIVGNILSG